MCALDQLAPSWDVRVFFHSGICTTCVERLQVVPLARGTETEGRGLAHSSLRGRDDDASTGSRQARSSASHRCARSAGALGETDARGMTIYTSRLGNPVSRQRAEQIRHPERHAARQAIYQQVGRGKRQPARAFQCVDCENQASEYDHYLGYAHEHWYDVEPVCRRCHWVRFKNIRIVAEFERLKIKVDAIQARRRP